VAVGVEGSDFETERPPTRLVKTASVPEAGADHVLWKPTRRVSRRRATAAEARGGKAKDQRLVGELQYETVSPGAAGSGTVRPSAEKSVSSGAAEKSVESSRDSSMRTRFSNPRAQSTSPEGLDS